MIDRFLSALPAIGMIVGYLLYYPYIFLFEYYRTVPHIIEKIEEEKVTINEYVMKERTIKDAHGRAYDVPPCSLDQPRTLSVPRVVDGSLSVSRRIVNISGRGRPIEIVVGRAPVFQDTLELVCVAVPQPLYHMTRSGMLRPVQGMLSGVTSKLEERRVSGNIVGYVTETEVEFRTRFDPGDFAQVGSVIASCISLLLLTGGPRRQS